MLITPPAAPITKDSPLETRQAKTKEMIQQFSTMGFAQLKNAVDRSGAWLWKNPLGLTAQQAFDALGADAAGAHALGIAAGGLINAALPGGWVSPDTAPVTPNQDGSVTVG